MVVPTTITMASAYRALSNDYASWESLKDAVGISYNDVNGLYNDYWMPMVENFFAEMADRDNLCLSMAVDRAIVLDNAEMGKYDHIVVTDRAWVETTVFGDNSDKADIRKRKDGRWEGRYTVGHDPETGKSIIKNVLGKTQAEVKEKLKKAIEENVGIDYGRAKSYTVGSWLEVWMENYAKVKLRPSTFKTSQGFLKNHIKPQIGGIPLADLTSLDLFKSEWQEQFSKLHTRSKGLNV